MRSTRRCSTNSPSSSPVWRRTTALRVVVLRGSGRHFCTGADLAARGDEAHGASSPGRRPTLPDVLAALDALPKPTVAVVHGGAVGGGAAFAACCDVVIAADSAFFAIPEVRVGMAPLGVAPFLIRAMGHRSFRRYGLTGERIPAAVALRLGLAHEVCETAQLDEVLGADRRRPAARRAGRDRRAQAGRRSLRRSLARGHSRRRTRAAPAAIGRRRAKASRASARSASRAGIRNEPMREASGCPLRSGRDRHLALPAETQDMEGGKSRRRPGCLTTTRGNPVGPRQHPGRRSRR